MSVKWKSGLNAPQFAKPAPVAPLKPGHQGAGLQSSLGQGAAPPPGPLPSKGSREALTSQLNALAYTCTNLETQKILRAAADAAEADAESPWLVLRSSGPSNIPETITGTIERGLDQGSPIVTFKPDDRSLGSFRLSPADLQGVADHGHVTIRKFGAGKGQKLEVDARGADRVRSFVGTIEARGKQLVAVALDPTAPIRELPLPGARSELLGKTVLAHVAEPLSAKRFGIVEEVVPQGRMAGDLPDLASRSGVEATFSPEEMADVAKIKKLFDPEKIQGYEDLTDKAFFAVDNPYSKDFDQAMHLEPSQAHPGATDVYYAIADVSYFLKLLGPGSALEARASRMQTTTYLPGLDAPVLDRALSEDLISLVAGKKRPAFVIKYTVGPDGGVLGQPTFHDAVVRTGPTRATRRFNST
jgi:exoribonuclease R